MPDKFDPDIFMLSKDDILYAVGKVKDRWHQNKRANFIFIHGMTLFEFGLKAVPEAQLTAVWGAILQVMNHLVELNALARMRGEFPKARDMIDAAVDRLDKKGF